MFKLSRSKKKDTETKYRSEFIDACFLSYNNLI